MSSRSARILLAVIALGVTGCDQASKGSAEHELRDQPVEVIGGTLDLEYTRNPGIAFSLDRVLPEAARLPVIVGIGLAFMAGLLVAWIRRGGTLSATTVGFAIIAGGALGNLADRFTRGYVVDFVHLHGWPVFNVADVVLVAGAGLFFFAGLQRQDPDGAPA
jgi:signal peptidase II